MGRRKAARGEARGWKTGPQEESGRKKTSAERGRCRFMQERHRQSWVAQGDWGDVSPWVSEGKQQESPMQGEEAAASAKGAPCRETKARNKRMKAADRRLIWIMPGNLLWRADPVKRE